MEDFLEAIEGEPILRNAMNDFAEVTIFAPSNDVWNAEGNGRRLQQSDAWSELGMYVVLKYLDFQALLDLSTQATGQPLTTFSDCGGFTVVGSRGDTSVVI